VDPTMMGLRATLHQPLRIRLDAFFEIICRRGARAFGKAPQALFEALELEVREAGEL